METHLQPIPIDLQVATRRLPPVPWRDPHTVPPAKLAEFIRGLEKSCAENPDSADLRTCLGMAHAMNYDAYKAMDVLEEAVRVDAHHFFAQLKLGELFYRLRALERAEEETLKALELAGNGWELSLSRKQLQSIRDLGQKGNLRPALLKPIAVPAVALAVLVAAFGMAVRWL